MEQIGKEVKGIVRKSTISKAISPIEGVIATKYALQGIISALLGDSSFLRLIIVQAMVIVFLVVFTLPLSLIDIAILLTAFALPLCTEIINVAIESIVDLVCLEKGRNELAGKAKDCAAGATFIAVTLWLIAVSLIVLSHIGLN